MKSALVFPAVVALAVMLTGAAADALAQPPAGPPPTPTQANMRQLGGASRALGQELQKDAPDPAALKADAAKLNDLASQLPHWFTSPTAPEGAKTAAKPEIWSDASGFAEAAKALQNHAARLVELSNGSDIGAIKAEAGALGGACKGCHDKYRAAEKK